MRLKTWHCLALLTLVVLCGYYPALQAGYNSTDDLKMVNSIAAAGPLDPLRFFVRSGSYYYRPLTIISYTLDRDLWDSAPSFMHLGNILLHLVNALLVYAITRRLLLLWKRGDWQWPALFAGLLFALHPITTESVAWISGRTDVLMTVFLLLAVWLTLIGLATQRLAALSGAAIALFLASLAKEVAVFVLPGLLWLIAVYPEAGAGLCSRLRRRGGALVTTTGAVVGYFALRTLAIGHDSGISTALKGVTGGSAGQDLFELLDKGRIALKVYGFYFKKLFVPWPLNFAIVDISDGYVLAGVLLAALLLYLLWRRDVQGAFGLMAFCVLSPALLVIYGRMTWTPLAERYLYASAALFAPAAAWLAIRLRGAMAERGRRLSSAAMVVLLLVFFGTTLHRAWVWQDNLRLYRDTVAKSPDFLPVRTELATALLMHGQKDEARAILGAMQAENSVPDYINDDLNLAATYLESSEPDRAYQLLLPLLNKNPKKRFDVLQALIRTNDRRLGKTLAPEEKAAIHRQNLEWLLEEQHLRPGPFTLYRIGKRYLALGRKKQALDYFRKAHARAPSDAHYRGAAEVFIKKLEDM